MCLDELPEQCICSGLQFLQPEGHSKRLINASALSGTGSVSTLDYLLY